MRKTTSLTVSLSFAMLVVTSIILYLTPQGRVAYWADWRLWGLTKTDWTNIHLNLGLLFLLSAGLHVYYNWRPLVSYLKNRTRQMRVFTREFNIALVLTAAVVAGTAFKLPPFTIVEHISTAIKGAAAKTYGEPPYGHAELSSLENFAERTGLDLGQTMATLQQSGIAVENERQKLIDIARANRISPQQVYRAMMPDQTASPANGLPSTPPPGTGNLTLNEICRTYQLDLEHLIETLAARNIAAGADATIKDIAAQHQLSPLDVYEAVRQAAGGSSRH